MNLRKIFPVLIFAAQTVFAIPPGEAALQIERKLGSLRSLRADFEHLYYSMTASEPLSEKGVFIFAPPDRMRWDSREPERQIFLYKEGAFLLYLPDENQLLKSRASGERYESEILILLSGAKSLRDDYIVEESPFPTEDPKAVQIKLTPKKEGDFAYILLEADRKSWLIQKAVFFDGAGNKQEFRFSRIEVDPKLPKNAFELDIPGDCEIIEQASGEKK